MIAEYDGNNNLLRKYIYGPDIDQPVCMIEVADSNAFYYYHFDALGSVVALSDSSGDTVQTYEYSVYGQVAVEDANHTNPYMFAGRRFDIEIGLYYNRARYYNPFMGRFLQTDPIDYHDGMNSYAYCGNSPLNYLDPSGLIKRFWREEKVYGYATRWWLSWKSTGSIIETPKEWYEAPVKGAAWTKKQFWWYYVQNGNLDDPYGEGWAPTPVNLGKVGLLEKFKADELVTAAVGVYTSEIMGVVRAAYAELFEIWGGKSGGNKLIEYHEHHQTYDFDRVSALWKYYNDLIVLGGGFLYCDANGIVTSDGFYKVTVTFSVNDWFIDVLDVANKIPDSQGSLDFDDGMPYQIVGSWTIVLEGKLE